MVEDYFGENGGEVVRGCLYEEKKEVCMGVGMKYLEKRQMKGDLLELGGGQKWWEICWRELQRGHWMWYDDNPLTTCL